MGTPISDTAGALIRDMNSQVESGKPWSFSIDSVSSRLGIPLVDCYRILYKKTPETGTYIPKNFGPDSIIHFLILLDECTGLSESELLMRNAGAFLDHEDTSELAAVFYDQAVSLLQGHTVDDATYEQMLRRYKRHERAWEAYRDYFFNADDLNTSVILGFVEGKNFKYPNLGRFTVEEKLQLLYQRNILNLDGMFHELRAHLRGIPAEEPASKGYSKETQDALAVFSLPGLPKTRSELRGCYKGLMKTYHPDINPAGLEVSKNINSAYSHLIGLFKQSIVHGES
ncbi:MAG: hypothetical protein HN368_21440 [Spirochaetales bacterium]|jgi:hypothetical protein|nr:hypothetical protein [Spirochaetales bacterium]